MSLRMNSNPFDVDHQVSFIAYHASDEAETIDHIVRNKQPEFTTYDEEWKKTGKGLMASK